MKQGSIGWFLSRKPPAMIETEQKQLYSERGIEKTKMQEFGRFSDVS